MRKPLNLHLEIPTPQKLDVAVLPPAPQIAGPVQAAQVRHVDEGLCGEFGPPHITPRQGRSADVELAHHADGHGLLPRIPDMQVVMRQ